MKVMILAAGYGRRLLPLTEVTPKPLLEVNGKSLIQRNIEILIDSGFDEFVINISYLGQMIKEHVNHTFPGIKVSAQLSKAFTHASCILICFGSALPIGIVLNIAE